METLHDFCKRQEFTTEGNLAGWEASAILQERNRQLNMIMGQSRDGRTRDAQWAATEAEEARRYALLKEHAAMVPAQPLEYVIFEVTDTWGYTRRHAPIDRPKRVLGPCYVIGFSWDCCAVVTATGAWHMPTQGGKYYISTVAEYVALIHDYRQTRSAKRAQRIADLARADAWLATLPPCKPKRRVKASVPRPSKATMQRYISSGLLQVNAAARKTLRLA